MNIERSITFLFGDKEWVRKLLLGGLFSLLFLTVFFGFAVVGYVMRVFCNALEGRDAQLPDWKNLVELFNEGLVPFLIMILYLSPLIVLFVIEKAIYVAVGGNIGLMLVFLIIRLVFTLAASILLPLGMIRFFVKRSVKAAFDLGRIIDYIGRNAGIYFTAWAVATFLFGLIAMVGIIGLGVGICLTGFAACLMSVHLYAQAYRASTPFSDDRDGAIRASMAIPPPLHGAG